MSAAVAGTGAAVVASGAGAHGPAVVVRAPRIPALAVPVRSPATTGQCPIPARFRPAFVHAARDTGFQLSMLVAVAQVESRFRADARSGADARGLLQVLPSTAASLRVSADTPAGNVLAGAR